MFLRFSLEWWWDSWEDVIRILNTWPWLGSEGEEEKVDSQDWYEKHGSSGLLHGDLSPGVGGRRHGVLTQLGSLDDQDLGEEHDVEDDDDDDGDAQEPITVAEIHPAVVILQFVTSGLTGGDELRESSHLVISPVDTVRYDEQAGTPPPDNAQDSDQEIFLGVDYFETPWGGNINNICLYEGHGEEEVKVGALTQHPGVVAQGQVGRQDVQQSEQGNVIKPLPPPSPSLLKLSVSSFCKKTTTETFDFKELYSYFHQLKVWELFWLKILS